MTAWFTSKTSLALSTNKNKIPFNLKQLQSCHWWSLWSFMFDHIEHSVSSFSSAAALLCILCCILQCKSRLYCIQSHSHRRGDVCVPTLSLRDPSWMNGLTLEWLETQQNSARLTAYFSLLALYTCGQHLLLREVSAWLFYSLCVIALKGRGKLSLEGRVGM